MTYSYADTDETIQDVLTGATSDGQKETVGRLIEAASNLVDRYTERPENYFAALDNESEPTARRYRGNGKNFLMIGRHVIGSASVQGVADSLFYEHPENGWLFSNDPAGVVASYGDDDVTNRTPNSMLWTNGALFIVSARWGFAATPSAIVHATKLITQHLWDKGKGVLGEVSPSGFVIERDIPPTARLALDVWKKRQFEIN
jgi:hypothetical protein